MFISVHRPPSSRLAAGPHTIALHLAEHHQFAVSLAKIWRILNRAWLIVRSRRRNRKRPISGSPPNSPIRSGDPIFTDYRLAPARRHTRRRRGNLMLSGRLFPIRPLHQLPPTSNRTRRPRPIQQKVADQECGSMIITSNKSFTK
jgi:hypothetical protein